MHVLPVNTPEFPSQTSRHMRCYVFGNVMDFGCTDSEMADTNGRARDHLFRHMLTPSRCQAGCFADDVKVYADFGDAHPRRRNRIRRFYAYERLTVSS